jgi:hypothetical protein
MPGKKMKILVCTISFLAPALMLTACVQKGPAQRAGENVDNAIQDMKDAVDPPGPAQKAGRALDRALGN